MSGSGTGIVTPYNTHRGMDFDGAADYYARAAGFAGAPADGPLGILSVYFRNDGGAVGNRLITRTNNANVLFGLNGNRFWIRLRTAVPAVVVELITTATYALGSGWHQAIVAWDSTIPRAQIYIDGAVPALTVNAAGAGNVDWTFGAIGWGAQNNGGLLWNGALSEGYLNIVETVDLTVEVNRFAWRHPNGQPPNLGAAGQLGTGTQPAMYMVEEGGVVVNRGYGGALALAGGAPALSADSPKDRWVASLNHIQRRRRAA